MEEVSFDQWTRSLFDTSFARPFCVYSRRRISAGEKADKERFALNLVQTIANFVQKALGDVVVELELGVEGVGGGPSLGEGETWPR